MSDDLRVRAKFRCLEVTKRYGHTDGEGVDRCYYRVKLAPVIGGKRNPHPRPPENDVFYALTPSGEMEMDMVSEQTAAAFVPGRAYYVDFTEAEG